MLRALFLNLAGLEEGKRYPGMNPPFLLPLLSSETGSFEVREGLSLADARVLQVVQVERLLRV